MNKSLENEKSTVLIVDDSVETVSMLNELLTSEGLTALITLNGAQAISMTKNFIPDIILLDALMPEMDGFDTCRKLRENSSLMNVPIIFMTGLSETHDIVKGFDSGGTDYVTKPISTEELIVRMRRHLANAKLTLSAKNALDKSGQYLFAANDDGQLLWSTPLCNATLNHIQSENDDPNSFRRRICAIIEGSINSSPITITLETSTDNYEIRYVGITGNNEHLLQVQNINNLSETEIIKDAFKTTQRESEVLLWLSKAKTNREIGLILTMSPRTVNKHLEQIYKKLSVDNRTAAATLCLDRLKS